jgi:hypothetical protein
MAGSGRSDAAAVVLGEPMAGTYAALHSFISGLSLGKTEAVMAQFEEHGVDCVEDLDDAADDPASGTGAMLSAVDFANSLGVTRVHARKILKALEMRRGLRAAVEASGLPDAALLLRHLDAAQVHSVAAMLASSSVVELSRASGLTKTQCRKIRKACEAAAVAAPPAAAGAADESAGADQRRQQQQSSLSSPAPPSPTTARSPAAAAKASPAGRGMVKQQQPKAIPLSLSLNLPPLGVGDAPIGPDTPSLLRRLSELIPPSAGFALAAAAATPTGSSSSPSSTPSFQPGGGFGRGGMGGRVGNMNGAADLLLLSPGTDSDGGAGSTPVTPGSSSSSSSSSSRSSSRGDTSAFSVMSDGGRFGFAAAGDGNSPDGHLAGGTEHDASVAGTTGLVNPFLLQVRPGLFAFFLLSLRSTVSTTLLCRAVTHRRSRLTGHLNSFVVVAASVFFR